MRSLFLKTALVLTVVLSWSGVPRAERTDAANGTNPTFKSIGPLAFSPDGVLFAGDTESAAIFALDLGKSATGGAPGAKAIPAFDQKVAALLGTEWVNVEGVAAPLGEADLLVVAPYNAQVDLITETLAAAGAGGVRVGTVDKFQGQEAPVVLFSTASSSPDDAPRGMEFLYDPHRLNVATSRGRCAAILIASPRLFEPACRTPRQIQLANGFCRFRELATVVRL